MQGCIKWAKVAGCTTVLSSLLFSSEIWAQQPTLEELQRRIDAGIAAKAKREATAARAAADQAVPERKSVAARKAEEAPRSTLVVRTDADCELSANGKSLGTVNADVIRAFKISGGEHLLECRSTEIGSVVDTQVKSLQSGGQAVLLLELEEQVQAVKQAHAQKEEERRADEAAERQRQAKAAADRQLCQADSKLLIEQSADVLRQCQVGLLWTQSDNGTDVHWMDATNHCNGKGEGWRLPTVAELEGIFDLAQSVPCGVPGSRLTCKASAKLQLSSSFFWTNQREGSSEAFAVYLADGTPNAVHVEARYFMRALCVRRP